MLALTGITETRREHAVRDALRGPAILGFCFALAVAFAATVWHGPSSTPNHASSITAAALKVPGQPS